MVTHDGRRYRLDSDRPLSAGRVREFWGNIPQVMKAYAWARSMGADGINEASDLSVLANNYMDSRLGRIRGLERSNPHLDTPRLEMTRWGLGPMKDETGVGTVDVANRMADYGIDPYWMSHEPWVVPEPFTPEAGEMYSREDLDHWIAVIREISSEAYGDPELVRTAPHRQAIHQVRGEVFDDPEKWAMTWRAYLRKHRHGDDGEA